jgi:hypothetical protein
MLDLSTTQRHVRLTGRVSDWLRKAGVDNDEAQATLAVGLVDSLAAARHVATDLESLLDLDPSMPAEADHASQLAGQMHAGLFTELKDHVAEMEALWEPMLEEELAKLCPPDEDASR